MKQEVIRNLTPDEIAKFRKLNPDNIAELTETEREKIKAMTDAEWLELFPVSVFHGVVEDTQDGAILARMYNPLVDDRIYRVQESGLYDGTRNAREFQKRVPQDARNAAEIAVQEEAIRAVQAEKIRRGIPLQRPRLDGGPNLAVIPGGLYEPG